MTLSSLTAATGLSIDIDYSCQPLGEDTQCATYATGSPFLSAFVERCTRMGSGSNLPRAAENDKVTGTATFRYGGSTGGDSDIRNGLRSSRRVLEATWNLRTVCGK